MPVKPKARIIRLTPDLTGEESGGTLEVSYNPTELTFSKSALVAEIPIPGIDQPILQYVRGQSETVTLDLFFDSTDENGMGDDAAPVTEKTDKFYQLIKIDRKTHAPPVCRFIWSDADPGTKMNGVWKSQNRGKGFDCIVESVKQRFTLFSPKGRPLRATLTVTLKEYRTLERQINEIFKSSPDHTHAHVVRRGETLAGIANEAYDDPSQWRAIALHNGIDDPLELVPGTVLEVPPIR